MPPTNANGNLGFRLSEDIRQNLLFNSDPTKQCNGLKADAIDATRTYTLIQSGSGCPGTAIPPNATNVAGSAIGFNPEWYGLLPNTNYTLCVTVTVPDNSCQLERLCMVYYHPTAGCTTCATATCSVINTTAATVIAAQTAATNDMTSAGVAFEIATNITVGTSKTICVPVTVSATSTVLFLDNVINVQPGQSISGAVGITEGTTVLGTITGTFNVEISQPVSAPVSAGTSLTFSFNTGTYIQFTGAVPAKPVVVLLGFDGFFPPG
jgi:hypothetical protein